MDTNVTTAATITGWPGTTAQVAAAVPVTGATPAAPTVPDDDLAALNKMLSRPIKKTKTQPQTQQTAEVQAAPQIPPHEQLWREMENTVFSRVKAVDSCTLEDVIRPLAQYDIKQLLAMPGTPQQVLTQQFLAYIRGVTVLREDLFAKKQCFNRIVDAINRCPLVKKD